MFSSEVTEDNQDTEVTLIDLLNKCPDISSLIFSTNILILRQTSKTIYDMLKNANIRIAIKNKKDYEFSNQEELSYKLNSLNTWCYVYKLYLLHCKLGDDGARAIANALRVNSTLQTLDLFSNDIGADGTRAIAELLRVNTTLQSLDLGRNCMGDDEVRAIAEALRVNSKLQVLDLYGNNIGDDGALAIAEALRVNTTLQKLDLRNNYVGYDVERALRESWNNRVEL